MYNRNAVCFYKVAVVTGTQTLYLNYEKWLQPHRLIVAHLFF